VWGLRIFGGEVVGALGCKVFVPRIILAESNYLRKRLVQDFILQCRILFLNYLKCDFGRLVFDERILGWGFRRLDVLRNFVLGGGSEKLKIQTCLELEGHGLKTIRKRLHAFRIRKTWNARRHNHR
jgi:hypothetical protein